MKLLDGKVALVTGAGSPNGIGFAACRRLAEHGARVVVTDLVRNDEDGERLRDRARELHQSGGEAMHEALDVTDAAQARRVVASALDRFDRLDIVFNNAGPAAGVGPFLQLPDAEFELTWRVNVMGTVNVCRAVLPVMQEQGGGSIINNASIAGIGGTPLFAGYSASKFGVVGLTKVLAAEFGNDNVRVNAICPGMIWTDMTRPEIETLRTPEMSFEQARMDAVRDVPLQRRWANPTEVGDAVVYLASDLASYVTGVALPVAGGLSPGV